MENNFYTIAEEYVVPSEGKIYSQQFDPHVTLRSMNTMEDMRRASPTTTPQKVVCDIIDACLQTKLPIRAYDMCIGDYEYLMHKLRVVTYGTDYAIQVGCPHCHGVFDKHLNLDELEVKKYNLKDFEELKEFILPVSKKKILLRFETPRDLDEVANKVKEIKKKTQSQFDPTQIVRMQRLIEEVDGEKVDSVALEGFIQKLPAYDSQFILNRINKMNMMIGLEADLDVTCDLCGGDIKSTFRYTTEFFRPVFDK